MKGTHCQLVLEALQKQRDDLLAAMDKMFKAFESVPQTVDGLKPIAPGVITEVDALKKNILNMASTVTDLGAAGVSLTNQVAKISNTTDQLKRFMEGLNNGAGIAQPCMSVEFPTYVGDLRKLVMDLIKGVYNHLIVNRSNLSANVGGQAINGLALLLLPLYSVLTSATNGAGGTVDAVKNILSP